MNIETRIRNNYICLYYRLFFFMMFEKCYPLNLSIKEFTHIFILFAMHPVKTGCLAFFSRVRYLECCFSSYQRCLLQESSEAEECSLCYQVFAYSIFCPWGEAWVEWKRIWTIGLFSLEKKNKDTYIITPIKGYSD